MADKNTRLAQNVEGTYYVDENCIACDACVVEAPKCFSMNDDEGHAFVQRQPQGQEQIDECENALAACPVGAIGNDG